MALGHLLDTSVLTRLREPTVRDAVSRLLADGTPRVSRLSCLELGFSARSGSEWREIQMALGVFTILEVDDEDHRDALIMQRDLADRGLRGRKLPDLLIAASAARLNVIVLHYDHDFDLIASVTGQPVAWIVPPGSVD
jgi:predicted nucleic acid-binding protein